MSCINGHQKIFFFVFYLSLDTKKMTKLHSFAVLRLRDLAIYLSYSNLFYILACGLFLTQGLNFP